MCLTQLMLLVVQKTTQNQSYLILSYLILSAQHITDTENMGKSRSLSKIWIYVITSEGSHTLHGRASNYLKRTVLNFTDVMISVGLVLTRPMSFELDIWLRFQHDTRRAACNIMVY